MPNNEITQIYKEKGLRGVLVKSAIREFRNSNTANWKSALFASRIVGKYGRGGTLGLAEDSGKSPDTIEDRAHAYNMFEKLCQLDNGRYRLFVFNARRLPFIYISHFRALYDVQNSFKLSDAQMISLLMDVVQAEGDISSRKLTDHVMSRFGDTRTWEFYAQKTQKELLKLLQQPDLPAETRKKASDLFNELGDNA